MVPTGKYNFRFFLCVGLILATGLLCNVAPAREVAVIKVKHRWAAELLPIVESMLSPEGTVTVSARVNSLVVVDTPEAIQRVQAYLSRFDRPVEQIRIYVRFHAMAESRNSEVSGRGRISGDDASVSAGGKRKDGIDISIQDRDRRQKSRSEFFIVAMSGSPAYIRAGKEVPYTQNPAFFKRYAPGGGTGSWQTVESGFEVTPTIAGNNAHLKIIPRIAYDNRDDAIIRFFGARTELTVPLGRWVEIGGNKDRKNEIIREILSLSKSRQNSAISMSLMVEKP